MKEYQKPELELVSFETEEIANIGVSKDDEIIPDIPGM